MGECTSSSSSCSHRLSDRCIFTVGVSPAAGIVRLLHGNGAVQALADEIQTRRVDRAVDPAPALLGADQARQPQLLQVVRGRGQALIQPAADFSHREGARRTALPGLVDLHLSVAAAQELEDPQPRGVCCGSLAEHLNPGHLQHIRFPLYRRGKHPPSDHHGGADGSRDRDVAGRICRQEENHVFPTPYLKGRPVLPTGDLPDRGHLDWAGGEAGVPHPTPQCVQTERES